MKQNIFDIKTEEDFRTACLATFRYQYENLKVYRKFVDYLNINPSSINQISDIPFLPIEMFKNHLVLDQNFETENYFQSSGTTQIQTRSKHYIADFSLYEENSECQANRIKKSDIHPYMACCSSPIHDRPVENANTPKTLLVVKKYFSITAKLVSASSFFMFSTTRPCLHNIEICFYNIKIL